MNSTKTHRRYSLAAGVAAVAAAAPLVFATPAFAGYWSLTGTPTGGYTFNPANSGSGNAGPTFGQSSMTLSGGAGGGGVNQSITGSFAYTGTIKWVPNGTLQQDPAPSSVTITESSTVQVTSQYTTPSAFSVNDGLGNNFSVAPSGRGGQIITSSGSKTTTVPVPAGGSYQFSRSFYEYIKIPSASDSANINYTVSVK